MHQKEKRMCRACRSCAASVQNECKVKSVRRQKFLVVLSSIIREEIYTSCLSSSLNEPSQEKNTFLAAFSYSEKSMMPTII